MHFSLFCIDLNSDCTRRDVRFIIAITYLPLFDPWWLLWEVHRRRRARQVRTTDAVQSASSPGDVDRRSSNKQTPYSWTQDLSHTTWMLIFILIRPNKHRTITDSPSKGGKHNRHHFKNISKTSYKKIHPTPYVTTDISR